MAELFSYKCHHCGANSDIPDPNDDTVIVSCRNCGNAVSFPPVEGIYTCEYCGSSVRYTVD